MERCLALGNLGNRFRSGGLDDRSERNERWAHRFTSPTLETKPGDLIESLINISLSS
jgi:hypothetical protein